MSDQNDLNIAGRLGKAAMFTNLTPMLSILIFLIGVVALMVTTREENPQIDVPAANVYVRMQGASPEEVQNLIVRPMEMVLREMTGVEHTYGMAMDSLAVVTVMFKVGEDKEASLVKLYDRIMHNLDHIPAGASQPLVKPMDVDDVPVSVITLSSTELDGLAMKRLAERVRDQLSPLEGVSVADIIGGQDREISIRLDPARLNAYHIALDQLHQVLRSANVGGPVGALVGGNSETKIWLDGFLRTAEEVGQLVVGQWQDKAVYLRDIATISDGASDVENFHRIGFGIHYSGQGADGQGVDELPAVSISLAKKRGTNAVVVTQRIGDKLAQLQGDFIPDNVTMTITRDSGENADAAVNMLLEHLGIAIATVILILLVFLGWREATIVTLNIPLILFVVLAVGLLADQTINRITLFALILALGLLVDDAIVVIENIHRHLHNGVKSTADKARLIVMATNETGKPTIVATIAVILAFIPMAFVTGMMGPYMGPIPFNTPVAMAASLVIAYMFTPWIAQRFLPTKIVQSKPSEHEHGNESKDWVYRTYMHFAVPLVESKSIRRTFWLATLLLFVGAMMQPGWQFLRPAGINGPLTPGSVELKMLPKGNKNTFNIIIDMPEGTALEETDRITRQIADVLRAHPMVVDYESFVGQAGPIDFNGMLRGAVLRQGASNLAEIRVNLVDKLHRSIRSDAIVLDLREQLQPVLAANPGANVKLVEDPPGPPVRATLLAEIYGPDYETQRALAKEVRKRFEQTYDVTDVDDSLGENQLQYNIRVDKEKASHLGVATQQVETALQDFLKGYDFGAVHMDSERHQVMLHVRLPKAMRAHAEDLHRIYVSGSRGPVPLSAFASIEEGVASSPMFSKDGHLVTYVTAEPKQGSQVYPLLEMDWAIDETEMLPGTIVKTGGLRFTNTSPEDTFSYHILWDGEMRLTLDVFRDLGAAFIVALVLIYLLMVAYYGQFILPMMVMAPTALTMIGIFPGHWITGQPFTATSMIGMIALAGIVVRNSTLLIDFILDYRKQGYSVKESVLEGGAVRARPILLTALAVVAGTSIMITDPVFGGLGVSMAFGTLAATILTLFVTPLMYYLWQREKA